MNMGAADLESSPVTSLSRYMFSLSDHRRDIGVHGKKRVVTADLLRGGLVPPSSAREWDVPRKRGGCGIAKEGKNGRRSRLHSLCGGGDLLYSDMAPFAQEDLFLL